MQWDPTITLGALINGAIFAIGLIAAVLKLGRMQQTQIEHTKCLEKHDDWMEQHDKLALEVFGKLERLIGHHEAIQFSDSRQRRVTDRHT